MASHPIYGYVDGAGFVRLSMAFDVLFTGLKQLRDDISRARNTVRCLSRSGGRSAHSAATLSARPPDAIGRPASALGIPWQLSPTDLLTA